MTLVWLIIWCLSGRDDPVVFSHLTTDPTLNDWAAWLVACVALDLMRA